MLGATRLTFRLHRFEVLVVASLLVILALSAAVVMSHVTAASVAVPDACFLEGATDDDPVCAALRGARSAADDEAKLVIQVMALAAPVMGLLLGVPLLAQEIEQRTTALAWSLSPSRRRWLAGRLLPMLALLIGGAAIVGLSTSWLADALEVLGTRSLDDIGSYGLVMITRALMALGVALLAGAVIGRSLPAFLVAAAIMAVWGLAGAPLLRQAQLPAHLVWMTYEARDQDDVVAIAYDYSIDGGDTYLSPDGRILTYREVAIELCGADPRGDFVSDQAQQCLDELEVPEETYPGLAHLVPRSALESFQMVEAGVGAAVGMGAILLTFPVVMRRRPG